MTAGGQIATAATGAAADIDGVLATDRGTIAIWMNCHSVKKDLTTIC